MEKFDDLLEDEDRTAESYREEIEDLIERAKEVKQAMAGE